jgi:hypothetical protein
VDALAVAVFVVAVLLGFSTAWISTYLAIEHMRTTWHWKPWSIAPVALVVFAAALAGWLFLDLYWLTRWVDRRVRRSHAKPA